MEEWALSTVAIYTQGRFSLKATSAGWGGRSLCYRWPVRKGNQVAGQVWSCSTLWREKGKAQVDTKSSGSIHLSPWSRQRLPALPLGPEEPKAPKQSTRQ